MIDFSNYTVFQQQAMNDVLYDLVERLEDCGSIWDYLRDMRTRSDVQLVVSIDAQLAQQAHDHAAAEAEKVNRIKEACIAGASPAEEPEPAPDMFGWVGDALDDLCAAGEALGSNE